MSKAETLGKLANSGCESFLVDDYVFVGEDEWVERPASVLERVHQVGLGPVLAVRSSGDSESLAQTSPPGAFHSELDVEVTDTAALTTAIDKVFRSIDRKMSSHPGVLVQTQLTDVLLAGVATTLDARRAPYVTVEFDDTSGRTDRVTGGGHVRRAVIAWTGESVVGRWNTVIAALDDIASIFDRRDLVVEFGVDHVGRVHVFQAWDRGRTALTSPGDLENAVRRSEGRLRQARRRTTDPLILSDMTDWNPAEMLGSRPGGLDVSIYRTLITDRTWARARAELSYFDCPGPLLVNVGAQPYVSVRQSFRSLSPGGLDRTTREAWVESCCARLLEDPSLHDKVESAILLTYSPLQKPTSTVTKRASSLNSRQREELLAALTATTHHVFSEWDRMLKRAESASARLQVWRATNSIGALADEDVETLIDRVKHAIRLCRLYGTLPFAVVARLAFIADGLVRELVNAGDVDRDAIPGFWQRVHTPAESFAVALADPGVPLETITASYGHLRPHSYNIESARYAADSGFLAALRETHPTLASTIADARGVDANQIQRRLASYLRRLGVQPGPDVAGSLAAALMAREWQKFSFTGVLSDALERLAELGSRFDLTRSELRALRLGDILTLTSSGEVSALRRAVDVASGTEGTERPVQFPDFIAPSAGLRVVEYVDARATYVTSRFVDAPIWRLDGVPDHPSVVDGHIVAIEAADPGFDWIFTRPVAGLITCYGGSASHMAIRCHELNVAAAIGCGTARFHTLKQGDDVILDCRNGSIVPVGGP